MEKIASLAGSIFVSLFLASCATPYVAPTSGPLAQIMLLPEKSMVMSYVLQGEECKTPLLIGGRDGKWENIRAGERSYFSRTFTYHAQGITTSCHIAFSFLPKAGERYESVWESSNQRCAVQLYRLTASSTRELEDTFQFEKPRYCR